MVEYPKNTECPFVLSIVNHQITRGLGNHEPFGLAPLNDYYIYIIVTIIILLPFNYWLDVYQIVYL